MEMILAGVAFVGLFILWVLLPTKLRRNGLVKSEDGQVVSYIDGYAWGIAPTGETICLGTETDVRTILANPKMKPRNPTSAQVISLERRLLVTQQTQDSKEQAKALEEKKERHQRAVRLGVAAKTRKPRGNKNRA